MRKIISTLLICALGRVGLLSAFAAGSQSVAFVSATGVDSGDCGSSVTPCRTLQYTLDRVIAPKGTVILASAGNYGAAKIASSVSIVSKAPAPAGVLRLSSSNDAITIAASVTDRVTLEGIVIDGRGEGRNAIHVKSAQSVFIKNCIIRELSPASGSGIAVHPTNPMVLTVQDTSITDPGVSGIALEGVGEASITASLTRVSLLDAESGLIAKGNVKASISDSVFMNNGTAVSVNVGGQVSLEASRILGNGRAIDNGGIIGLSNSTLAINGDAITQASAATYTFRNNVVLDSRSGPEWIIATPK